MTKKQYELEVHEDNTGFWERHMDKDDGWFVDKVEYKIIKQPFWLGDKLTKIVTFKREITSSKVKITIEGKLPKWIIDNIKNNPKYLSEIVWQISYLEDDLKIKVE